MDDSDLHPLTAARRARGLSQTTLAARVRQAAARRGLRSGCDRPRIRKWERGTVPDSDSQLYLAQALGLPVEALTRLPWPHWLHSSPDGVVPLTPHSAVPALREALTPVERRTFLTLSGAGLTDLASQWAASSRPAAAHAGTAGRTDTAGDLVDALRTSTDRLTAAGPAHEQHTTRLLAAHLHTVTDLLETGGHHPATQQRLHTLAADLAHTLAWRHFDRGAHPHAARHWMAALHNTHAVSDTDRSAGLISDLAYQAAWRNDHTLAQDLLSHALTRARHPAARSLLNLRLARSLAASPTPRRRAALHALHAAEHELNRAGTNRPSWCTWMSEADLAVDTGQTLLDLGDTRPAHQLLTQGEQLLPTTRDKTRGVFLAYQAASHLTHRDIEPAAHAATAALDLARRTHAPRCEQLVQRLTPAFRPYAHHHAVGRLLHLTGNASTS
ncbi:helix-turn-helix domain-containing protein [Streptomyces parvulus]|uniref:helix-turn-helix domain-containing protein n=1 Tax=Streptomyces parvulus TaxID=146923 RepID=UPI001CFAA7C7|nr:helix-turn-helix transcriptional regulator [Streptomyces parvulus]